MNSASATLSKEKFVNADLLVCENGSVWDTSNIEEPKNLSKPFQEKNIPINFVLYSYETESHVLGGPTGLWATINDQGFEECKEIPGYYTWMGATEFNNCELEWFGTYATYYFNAKGNVYSTNTKEPYYAIVWENRQIIQFRSTV